MKNFFSSLYSKFKKGRIDELKLNSERAYLTDEDGNDIQRIECIDFVINENATIAEPLGVGTLKISAINDKFDKYIESEDFEESKLVICSLLENTREVVKIKDIKFVETTLDQETKFTFNDIEFI
ncbi:hypothetical protein [Kurthia gibsonii]|uniref:hypothetical protein n=1 Tax=Kurthia gibsonii TaxID=33946 RepID=UPI0031B717B2